jgi:hypothetical protein
LLAQARRKSKLLTWDSAQAHHRRRFGASLRRDFWRGYTVKTDLELTTAHRELLSLDRVISGLYEKFGDSAEGKADLIEAEERRFEVLECLATIQASSPAGMVAKARVLKAVSVADDFDRQAAIAASLADDVLRYFSYAG